MCAISYNGVYNDSTTVCVTIFMKEAELQPLEGVMNFILQCYNYT